MPVRAVFFDVGETLVDERGYWRRVADLVGLPEHVVLAALGITIARGEHHGELFRHLGLRPPAGLEELSYEAGDLYPDALPCLLALRHSGYRIGVCGNQTAALERFVSRLGLPVDVVGSAASWGVAKPAAGFFLRLIQEAGVPASEIAYVGDRVDYDVVPALEMGLLAVHVRRGPWGHLQQGAERAHVRIESLAELAPALRALEVLAG